MTDGGAGAFLSRLTAKLAAAGVPSMVVGSFASSFHGVPRSSQDLDLVIDRNCVINPSTEADQAQALSREI